MKYLTLLSLLFSLLLPACQDTYDEVLPANVFEGEVDFVEITNHAYLDNEGKGRIEFTINLDVFTEEQRERITRYYFKYNGITRFMDNLEQRSYAFPVERGVETCIRFGFIDGEIYSNLGKETCLVFI